ncbi:MAG: hypothetical protein ACJAZM_003169 [Cyclobacteriaceae bacterium]|jgi:hypothetical protein
MNRVDFRYLVLSFIVFVLVQLAILYKFVLLDTAIAFIYVGFLVFLPFKTSQVVQLSIGFLVGLFIDVFSNTPGMHAAASVLIMFLKDYWLLIVSDEVEEEINISVFTLGGFRSILFTFPLILIHHLVIFSVEFGRWSGFLNVINKAFWSAILSTFLILLIDLLIAKRKTRS